MVPPGLSGTNFQSVGVTTAVDTLVRGSTYANVICRLIVYSFPEQLQAQFAHCVSGDFACVAEVARTLGQLLSDSALSETERQPADSALAYLLADNTTSSGMAAHAHLVAQGGVCVICEGGCRFKFATSQALPPTPPCDAVSFHFTKC